MASKKGTFLVIIGIPPWHRTRPEMRSEPWGFTLSEATRREADMLLYGWRDTRIVDILKSGSEPRGKRGK